MAVVDGRLPVVPVPTINCVSSIFVLRSRSSYPRVIILTLHAPAPELQGINVGVNAALSSQLVAVQVSGEMSGYLVFSDP